MEQYWHTVSSAGTFQFKIRPVFGIDSLNLQIFEPKQAWSANIKKNVLEEQSKKHQTEVSSYLNNVKNYLKHHSDDVELKFVEGHFTVHVLLKNKMKLLYFEATMLKTDFGTSLFEVTDNFYENNTKHLKELMELKNQNSKLKENNERLKIKLEEFVERKNKDEQELLSKFLMLLNEKKRQIQHLNDLLLAFKKGRPVTNPVKPTKIGKKSGKNKPVPQTPISESESEDSNNTDYETDSDSSSNEDQPVIVESKKKLEIEPKPSTSKTKFCFDDDSPPLPSLTKRLRISSDSSLNTTPENTKCEKSKGEIVESESAKAISTTIENTKTSKEEIVESKSAKAPSSDFMEESPTVDFNTQELLDNM
ncbi:uncharacterized protein LOC115887929 [Sitophilus oryzae]|uniref:Uncharacterized protein LOC115887929 n=1 Tax=Sitophilus oryzae TaxID=7048 RepID=A0A6J2YIV4_SITOR|nr:uncharacterized protein LOC115887929 [Sitophilus oryzae]